MGGYVDEEAAKIRDAQLERLGKLSRGKSCLYVNKLADVDLEVLEEMIKTARDCRVAEFGHAFQGLVT